MLHLTNVTKKTLQLECDEAKFALKPWTIESTVVKPIDKSTCICGEGLESEDRAEEIAADLGRTLQQSALLREKLAANLQRERQNSRRPELHEIYRSASKQTSSEKENRPRGRSSSQHAANAKSRSSSVSGSKLLAEPVNDVKNGNNQHKNKPKNFILANKLSVRGAKSNLAKRMHKSQGDLSKAGLSVFKPLTTSDKTPLTSIRNDEVETLSEIDRLIKKFTLKQMSDPSEPENKCPVHAENASTVIEEKVITFVDAVEGLDRFGVPSYFIKILKTYHTYLKNELFDDITTVTNKQQDAANHFLRCFEKVGQKQKSANFTGYESLLSNYSFLYHDSFRSKLNSNELKDLKTRFITLERIYKECDVKNTVGDIKFTKSNSDEMTYELPFDMQNWTSNGIWNNLCTPFLKDQFGSHCIRYYDRNHLLQFSDLIQKIQRHMYEIELLGLLMLNVIPKLKELYHPNSLPIIEIYKMIVTVAQTVNLKVPIIAKTED